MKHIYTNGDAWVVASSPTNADDVYRNATGAEEYDDTWTRVEDDLDLEVYFEEFEGAPVNTDTVLPQVAKVEHIEDKNGKQLKVTAPAGYWAQINRRQLLCEIDY